MLIVNIHHTLGQPNGSWPEATCFSFLFSNNACFVTRWPCSIHLLRLLLYVIITSVRICMSFQTERSFDFISKKRVFFYLVLMSFKFLLKFYLSFHSMAACSCRLDPRPFIRDANKHDRALRGLSGKGCDEGVVFQLKPPGEETLKARRFSVLAHYRDTSRSEKSKTP